MEGVAYSLRDCMEVLYRLGVTVNDTVRIIGGGSKSAVWRQIVADVLDMPLCQSLTDDSSVGSAMLAGVACGLFSSFEESVAVCSKAGGIVEPNPKNRQVYDHGFEIYRRIHDALEDIYHDLNEI